MHDLGHHFIASSPSSTARRLPSQILHIARFIPNAPSPNALFPIASSRTSTRETPHFEHCFTGHSGAGRGRAVADSTTNFAPKYVRCRGHIVHPSCELCVCRDGSRAGRLCNATLCGARRPECTTRACVTSSVRCVVVLAEPSGTVIWALERAMGTIIRKLCITKLTLCRTVQPGRRHRFCIKRR